jgi:hypothetical protein
MYLIIRYLTAVLLNITLQFMMERKSIKNAEDGGEYMKRMILTVALCMFLTIAFMPAAASADWGFRMGEDGNTPTGGHVNFRKIEFFIPDVPQNAGVTWSGSGVSNFSSAYRPDPSPSWNDNTQKINPTYVLATGNPVRGTLFWDFLFTGQAPTDFRLDYLVFRNINSTNPVYGISMMIRNGVPNFTSSGWTTLNLSYLPNYNRTSAAVPVPPTVFLLGAGLIGVVVLRKRIHS